MTRPDSALIREQSKVDFAARGYPAPSAGSPDPLEVVVDQAIAYIEFVTWRKLDSSMPASIEPLATQAARMRTEQIVMQAQEDTVETAGDVDLISSFGAGSYTETRKDTTKPSTPGVLNPWPALNELLWMLLGLGPGEVNDLVDQRRDYWRYILGLQPNAPSWAIVEADWSRGLSGNAAPVGVITDEFWSEPWSRYV
jgi:hypothetical protein